MFVLFVFQSIIRFPAPIAVATGSLASVTAASVAAVTSCARTASGVEIPAALTSTRWRSTPPGWVLLRFLTCDTRGRSLEKNNADYLISLLKKRPIQLWNIKWFKAGHHRMCLFPLLLFFPVYPGDPADWRVK